jgi:hypothetical protein
MIDRVLLAAFLICVLAVSAACQSQLFTPSPTETTLLNVDTQRRVEGAASAPEWVEGRLQQLRIGLWKPAGWTLDDSAEAMTLLQHNPSIVNGVSSPENGIIINLFAPSLDHLEMPPPPPNDHNFALWILRHVVNMPSAVGTSVHTSEPTEFDWNGYPAAYYLLSGAGTRRAIVIGVELPESRMLAINIAMPESQVERARALLPELFADFSVSGIVLGGEALRVLPDPLSFPMAGAAGTELLQIGG